MVIFIIEEGKMKKFAKIALYMFASGIVLTSVGCDIIGGDCPVGPGNGGGWNGGDTVVWYDDSTDWHDDSTGWYDDDSTGFGRRP